MAKEVLVVPERHLADVIKVIRAGLWRVFAEPARGDVSREAEDLLKKWCGEEEEHLKRLGAE